MTFDWKRLERDDGKRDRQVLLTLGICWTAIGVVGTLVILAIGRAEKLTFNVIWISLGVVMLISGLLARRRHAGPSRNDHT